MFANDDDRQRYQKEKAVLALIIHRAKCNRGEECPILSCCQSRNSETINAFLTSDKGKQFMKHYMKCRAQATNVITRGACHCGIIRFYLQNLQAQFLPPRQLSLEFLAACAVPYSPSLIIHPLGETAIALRAAAIKVQRRWRAFLNTRGPQYRTALCRYYRQGRCSRGVHCTFAHGEHDLRQSFGVQAGDFGSRDLLHHLNEMLVENRRSSFSLPF